MEKTGEVSFLQQKAAEMGIHTTLTREIRPEYDLNELLERWQEAKTIGDMEGIIHRLFQVQTSRSFARKINYDKLDRLIFCFILADGWADYSLLEIPEDWHNGSWRQGFIGYDDQGHALREILPIVRQRLARKAFDSLCLNFFKKIELKVDDRRGQEFADDWERVVISERLFPIVQNFFAAQEGFGGRVDIRNLICQEERRPHTEQLAIAFLLNLAKFLWGWNEACCRRSCFFLGSKEVKKEEYLSIFRARLDAAKPWMIEVLNYLGRLDLLREWLFELDKASLAKLKEIAMRSKIGQPYYCGEGNRYERLVVSLDEARLVGSPAAWLLAEYEVKAREYKRLMAIQEEQRKRDEADRKLKKLTGDQR